MAKAVFNLDLGGGIIKHTHPEQTQNTSNISTISSDYVSLTQEQTIYGNKTIEANVFIEGVFTASSAVFLDVETIPISGNSIVLNYNLSGAPFEDANIVVNRGSETDAYLYWNEASNLWQAGLDGNLYTMALEDTEVDFTQVNVGDNVTVSNATRPFNIADTNGVARILSIGLDPSLEFIHRDTADGADNAYWDIGADDNDHYYIRKRTGGPVLSALTIDSDLNMKTYGDLQLLSGTNINEFSTDGTLAGSSDDALPTEQAVKTYVDNKANFNDVAYLRYNAVSGTLNGELGCTLTSPSGWTITQTEVIYYVDPRDVNDESQSLIVTIPDATSDNLNQTIAFRKPNLAGDLGLIRLQTESGQNIGPSTSYTFNHPSDYIQLVSNEFEFGSGSYKWRQSYDKRIPINYVEVDINGYTGYSSIQAAIDSIKDANSTNNTYTVGIYPGTYDENIILKDGVNITGLDNSPYGVKINPSNGGSVISWLSGTTYSHISNIHILGNSANPGSQRLIESSNGTHLIKNCAIDWYMTSLSAETVTCLSAAGDTQIQLDNCLGGFYQYGSNALSGCHYIFLKTEDNANVHLHHNNIDIYRQDSISGQFEELEFWSDNSSYNGSKDIKTNIINFTIDNPLFDGSVYLYENYVASDGCRFSDNQVVLSGNSTNGEISIFKTKGYGSSIRSTGNNLAIYGFGTNYMGIIASGDTLNSHYDYTVAVGEVSGNGTYNYVNTPSPGNISISNNLTVENDVIIPLLSGDNTVVTSDTNGVLQDTTVSITEGPSGGSVINLIEFTTDPDASELVVGDMWILDSLSTSGKIWKYFDGTDKYSVEMSKE